MCKTPPHRPCPVQNKRRQSPRKPKEEVATEGEATPMSEEEPHNITRKEEQEGKGRPQRVPN